MNAEQREEFEWFSELEQKLVRVFADDGHEPREAQESGFFVALAIRDVPPLLKILAEVEKHSTDEVLDAVHAILSNRSALMEAAKILRLTNERD